MTVSETLILAGTCGYLGSFVAISPTLPHTSRACFLVWHWVLASFGCARNAFDHVRQQRKETGKQRGLTRCDWMTSQRRVGAKLVAYSSALVNQPHLLHQRTSPLLPVNLSDSDPSATASGSLNSLTSASIKRQLSTTTSIHAHQLSKARHHSSWFPAPDSPLAWPTSPTTSPSSCRSKLHPRGLSARPIPLRPRRVAVARQLSKRSKRPSKRLSTTPMRPMMMR